MKSKIVLSSSVLLALLLVNSSANAQPIPESVMDKWYNPTPRRSSDSRLYYEFSPQLSFRVRPVRLQNAIEELATSQIKPIDRNRAIGLIGNSINITPSLKPYLVRGVYFHDGTGGFRLLKKGRDLLVMHTCLGDFVPMKRQPLVIFLNWKPRNVYIEAHVSG